MLRGVIDESGTHSGARALCVAGCVGTSTQWLKLREKWDRIVVEELGAVEKYHAKSAACADLNYLLADLIVTHMDYGIVAVIREADFKAIVPHRVRSFFGSAYKIGVETCLSYISLFHDRRKKVAYMIEVGHKNQAAVEDYLKGVLGHPESKKSYGIQSVTWVGKHDAVSSPMIHLADLVAHETASCVDGTVTPLLKILLHKVEVRDLDRRQLAGFAYDAAEARGKIKASRRTTR